MKKIFSIFAMLFVAIALCACTPSDDPDKDDEQSDPTNDTYVSLDINPSIEIIVSEDNKVVNIYAKNDDAKVLIAGELTFVGEDLQDAIKRLIDLCIEYGYLTEENSDVQVTVSSPDEETISDIENKVEEAVNEEVKGLSFAVTIHKGLTEEMKQKYEDFKAELGENGIVADFSVEKFKLAESAVSSDPTLEMEVAITLNEEELIKRIKSCRDEAYNFATEAYEKAVEEVEKTFDKLMKTFERSKYMAYYAKNMFKHKVNYGALYVMYGGAADATEAIIELQKIASEQLSNLLTDEQIAQITAKITEIEGAAGSVEEAIKDENGNVTVDSIKAYLDEIYLAVEDEEVKAKIDEVRTVLTEIEGTLIEQSQVIKEEYIPQLQVMLATLEASLATFKVTFQTIAEFIPDTVKESMELFISETDLLVDTITQAMETTPTLEDLESWVETFRAKEEEMYNKMTEDLSKEEIDEIEGTQLPQELLDAKEELQQVKEDAKQRIEEQLKQIKEDRKPQGKKPIE